MALRNAQPSPGAGRVANLDRVYRLVTTAPALPAEVGTREIPAAARWSAIVELALSTSGVALVLFLVMHLGLLLSVLLGTQPMDTLASFLERYYLLQAAAPLLIVVVFLHIVLALRRLPASLRQQRVLWGHMRRMWHLDTWTWVIQLASGLALLSLVSVHLWVVLSTLPVQAARSGGRVYETYLWFYVPFILLAEAHLSFGLYRVAVKWGLVSRRTAHIVTTAWTIVSWGLGFAILVTLYRVGAGL